MALTCNPIVDKDCGIGDAIVGNVFEKALESWAKSASDGAATVIKMVVSGWVNVPSGTVTDPAMDKTGAVAHLQGHTFWLLAALTVGGLLFAGLRMAMQPDGREAGQLVRNLVWMVVIAGAGVPAITLMTGIGDDYSWWILDKSADGDFGGRMALLTTAAVKVFPGVHFLILIMGALVAFSGIIQLMMLLGRAGALILMAGLLPLAAAGALTGRTGMETRNRYLTWILAIILYKPAAATIYAAAFWAIGKGDKPMDLFIALALFVMAALAAPALMRLIAPAVSAATSSESGTMGAAMAGGVGSLATGAVQLSGMGSGSRSSGGGSDMGGASGAASMASGHGAGSPMQGGGGPGAGSASGGAGQATGSAVQASGTTATTASGAGAGASAGAASAGGAGVAAGAAGGPVGAGVMAAAGVAKAGAGVVKQVSSGLADGASGASEQGSRR